MKLLSRTSNVEFRTQEPDGTLFGFRHQRAFTLLEVMIAMFVFFIVVFAILGVVVQSLGAARALQRPQVDGSIVAAQLSLTNCFEEGYETGDFEDMFPNHRWERATTPIGTNNMLWQIDIAVFEKTKSGKENVETMSVLMAKPACNGIGVRR
jgi:type II secretory pathway pseudopilin PulG